MEKKDLYSVLMPTYNERTNLPIMVYLIMEMAEKQYTSPPSASNHMFLVVITLR